MRALTVCVGFSDYLSVTLPKNRHNWSEVMIVTTPADTETIRVAKACRARLHLTDVFHADGAKFNKFAAIEEALDSFGRHGWIALVDADVIWPEVVPTKFEEGNLYGPIRRLWTDERTPIPDESRWGGLHHGRTDCFEGFTQIFHADDSVLGKQPWHRIDLPDAGAGDGYFADKWPQSRRVRTEWDVLHIGESRIHWEGRK